MNWRPGLAAWVLVTVATLAPWPVGAQVPGRTAAPAQAVVAKPVGEPVPGSVLEDTEFGVRTDQFGLDRRVEMFQWYRDRNGDYERVWKPALVDSSAFAPGHQNPGEIPLQGQRWWATDASLDGRPLDLSVLKTLGQWEDFRPGFSRLRANLAATFQPEGDGLGSSDNPLDPKIGDLRIHWRQLRLPELSGHVELEDGRWQLATRPELETQTTGLLQAAGQDSLQTGSSGRWFWIAAGALALAFVLALLLRRRLKR
ncbi:TMEM43 family protein [Lysobacter sp. A421]